VGTPEEIYAQPADDFVFRFLGIANFLPVRRDGDALWLGGGNERWTGPAPVRPDASLAAGFRPSDVLLARSGPGLPGTVRRASFLGAQVDYLIDVAGTLVRVTTPSHECVEHDLLFVEGETCRIDLATVQWFPGDVVAGISR
jgi:iron(III) transport system ATP-binding protein